MRSIGVTCPRGGDISRNLSCILFKSGKSPSSSLGRQPAGQIPLLITISSLDTMASPNSYLCDTLPQAKLAQTIPPSRSPPSHGPAHTSVASQSERPSTSDNLIIDPPEDVHPTPAPPPRKLCPRHKRMADEGTNLKLQQVCSCQFTTVCIILMHIPPRLWMLFPCRNGRLSTPSGRTSPPHHTPGGP